MGYRGQEKEYIVCALKMFIAQWKENLKLTNGKIPVWYTKSSLAKTVGRFWKQSSLTEKETSSSNAPISINSHCQIKSNIWATVCSWTGRE